MIWNHISKVKPVELYLMNLGCSLAVIRFNEGLAVIQNIIDTLGLSSYISIHSLVRDFDNENIRYSFRFAENTKRRWSIKQAKCARTRIRRGY